jgi:exodeoxyribonuclease VII small subunit
MSDDRSTFETTRARLEDIVVQVRRKDVSLEQSLDMLEEAVRLVNQCNDLIDQTSFRAPVPADGSAEAEAATAVEDASVDAVAVVEGFDIIDADGDDVGSLEVVEVVEFESSPAPVEEIEDDERS